ncbi:transposase family protein [Streptomyces murinus]|uniref:transposase family protein n=1 Tax=Streptomyces murinus TaxID=33900 RepID=UPI00380DD23D
MGEGDFVIVDGTLIPADRVAADKPYYSQKHRKHGVNVQVVAHPDGTPLWFSRATPGRTHDLTAARARGIIEACLTRRILVWPTARLPGHRLHLSHPCKHHREQPAHYQRPNRGHARLRASGERAFAQLKTLRLLRRARCSTRRISTAVQTLHTLLTCDYSGQKRLTEPFSSCAGG